MNSMNARLVVTTSFIFLTIFGWKITPILDLSVLICAPILLIALARPQRLANDFLKSMAISIPLIILIAYSLIIYATNDPTSHQWLLRNVRAAISFGAIFIFVRNVFSDEPEHAGSNLLLALSIAISLHATIAILSQFITDFRYALQSMTNAALYVNEMTILMDNRPLGLTYSLAITSFLYFVAVAILIHIPAKTHLIFLGKFSLITINIIACTLTARTGLIFIPIVVLLCYRSFLIKSATDKILIVFAFTLVATLSFLAIYLGPHSASTLLNRFSDLWVLLSSPSDSNFVQIFIPMWHLPTDSFQLLFGNSLTGREEGHYVASDIGYVLAIYGIGLVGQLLMLLPILVGGYTSSKLFKTKPSYALLALIILGSYLILNVKELALLTRTVWPVICVFISISLLEYQALRKRQNGDETSQ